MKILKQIFVTFFMLIALSISAQQGINYKALIKDGSGNVVASQGITVQFQILQGGAMTNVYQETHTSTTDANGIVIVNIGEGTTSDMFTDVDWGADDHFLNVQINTGGGLTDMGTTQFRTVPYALNAANAATKIDELSDGKSDPNGSSLFLGVDAGLNDDGTANKIVGIGFNALFSNTTGAANTATGYYALYSNTEGFSNTANGYAALYSNISGTQNTAIGNNALYFNTEGYRNTATGFQALKENQSGYDNTANGYSALYSNTLGNFNTATGSSALNLNTEGNYNTANGRSALSSNITGNNNTAIGYLALRNNTANNNTATGYYALLGNDTGFDNTANGAEALRLNTIGYFNTANGAKALYYNTEGNENTATGHSALYFNEGDFNSANGSHALYYNDTGNYNTANGAYALYSNTEGISNTANGFNTLRYNTIGNYNTANGVRALYYNTSGTGNTAFGYRALMAITTGENNTAIGNLSLNTSASGSNNIAIGYDAQVLDGTDDNQVRIGNSNIASLSCMGAYNGTVGIFNRDVYVDTSGKIGYIASSARYKNNIVTIENIDWIYNLRPVNYSYKKDVHNLKQYGLIAEEVEKINTTLISYNKDGTVETVNYSKLIAPMLKAIQEQQEIIESQNEKILSQAVINEAQETEINSLSLDLSENKDELTLFEIRLKQIETLIKSYQ